MQNLSISLYLLLGLFLSVGKMRLSLAGGQDGYSCSIPEPTDDECWKAVLATVVADGAEGRFLPPNPPSPKCCAKVRNWGQGCFWSWVNGEAYKIECDPELILFNGEDMWDHCQNETQSLPRRGRPFMRRFH
ncbi:unnamed protein product [Cuscuta europaea]|uniref:Uncharacterized protein n=1 Tax=Cuscuta europaea TaxID=41803 RepID=A0A9P1EFI6_CUSEU|nr:unnamed protein product [Cuscuta europaea]